MNKMVFELQPDIIVNNRNGLEGDFATPEQRIKAEKRAWESCMTMNDSWGYQKADDNWKSPKTVVRNLIACARDTGNYLLNIGPKRRWLDSRGIGAHSDHGGQMDGSQRRVDLRDRRVPAAAVELCQLHAQSANTLYMHVHFWPGTIVALGGLEEPRCDRRGCWRAAQDVKFDQDPFRVRFINLPEKAPDDPVTTIAIECDGEPQQDTDFVRRERPRT